MERRRHDGVSHVAHAVGTAWPIPEEERVTGGERMGFGLPGQPSVREMMALAKQAEELGFESVWLTETRFTRGAVLTAVTFATLDELAEGRAIFGFGPGSPHILRRQGYAFDLPVTRMTEHIEVVRQLLTGERVSYHGRTVTVEDVALDFRPTRPSLPLYLGVTGPKALGLAGEIADGVILNGFVSADYSRGAVQRLREAATRAGRSPDDIDIASWLMVSVDRDSAVAKDAVRPMVATYLANFPNIARESGLPGELLDTIGQVYAAGGAPAAAEHVSDEIVTRLACAGTAEECRALIQRRRDVGVTLPILGILGGDVGAAMESLVAQS
jgi:5,10-methylenetetrahydromethanopterin reductase